MRQRNEHAMSPDTWCGLNRPDRTEKDVDAVIFGIPFDGGVSYRGGAAEAPDLLRANTITSTPSTEKLDHKLFESMKLISTEEFTGKSHEIITMERYIP